MTKIMDRIVNDVQELSQDEKNYLVKFLIASMDNSHDENSEQQWADLAKSRLSDIESGKIETQSWEQIKQRILS